MNSVGSPFGLTWRPRLRRSKRPRTWQHAPAWSTEKNSKLHVCFVFLLKARRNGNTASTRTILVACAPNMILRWLLVSYARFGSISRNVACDFFQCTWSVLILVYFNNVRRMGRAISELLMKRLEEGAWKRAPSDAGHFAVVTLYKYIICSTPPESQSSARQARRDHGLGPAWCLFIELDPKGPTCHLELCHVAMEWESKQ